MLSPFPRPLSPIKNSFYALVQDLSNCAHAFVPQQFATEIAHSGEDVSLDGLLSTGRVSRPDVRFSQNSGVFMSRVPPTGAFFMRGKPQHSKKYV